MNDPVVAAVKNALQRPDFVRSIVNRVMFTEPHQNLEEVARRVDSVIKRVCLRALEESEIIRYSTLTDEDKAYGWNYCGLALESSDHARLLEKGMIK